MYNYFDSIDDTDPNLEADENHQLTEQLNNIKINKKSSPSVYVSSFIDSLKNKHLVSYCCYC